MHGQNHIKLNPYVFLRKSTVTYLLRHRLRRSVQTVT